MRTVDSIIDIKAEIIEPKTRVDMQSLPEFDALLDVAGQIRHMRMCAGREVQDVPLLGV